MKDYKPIKTEVIESVEGMQVKVQRPKVEGTSNVVDDKPTTLLRKLKAKQYRKPGKFPIKRIIKIKPASALASAILRIKIKPAAEHSPAIQEIKIKPPTGHPHEKLEIDKQRYNIQTLLQCSNATPIRRHAVGSGYSCCFCNEHFPKASELKTHTIQDHDDETKNKFMQRNHLFSFIVKLDITSLNCNICRMDFDTVEQLIDHLNNTHQKGLHTDIKSHIACFKLDNEETKCHICSAGYHSFKLLQEHMNKHYMNFICDECGAGFINRSQLKIHSSTHQEGAYKCETCDKVFKSVLNMQTHVRQTHSGIYMHRCYQCDERFKTKGSKINHMREDHGVVFADLKCDACNRTFKNNDGLRIHRKRDHLMERRFQCELCDRRFFTAGMLKEHEVTHTGLREFKCEVCLKSYSRKFALREHMRSHTGDRRFKCSYCDMTFLQKCSLKSHLRSRHDANLQ